MVARAKRKHRCRGCGLAPSLCACELFPEVAIATPLVIVQHIGEHYKPTNTGRLLAKMVPGVPILPYGQRDPPFDPGPLCDRSIAWFVVFPRDDATELPPGGWGTLAGRRRGFVVLDGTWHQCSRMARRVPVVRELPCVALPAGYPSIWKVRTQHDPRGLSTFEASVRVIAQVEGDPIVAPLMRAFEQVTARALYMKGKLASPQVPESWP